MKIGEKEVTLDALFKAAAKFKGDSAVSKFIKEVLTEGEQVSVGRRILIANMMLAGYNQPEIRERLGVSPNTFGKIRKWLLQKLPNYNAVLKQSYKEEGERVEKRRKPIYNRPDPLSFTALKKKYPLHFLLFNIAEEVLDRLRKF